MAPYQIVAVAVRLFAIWLAVYAVRTAPAFLFELRRFDDEVGLAISLGVAALVLAVVFLLWFFPRSVARALVPGIATSEPVASSPNDWFTVGCSLIGLWLLTATIPGLVNYLTIIYLIQHMPGEVGLDASRHANAISFAVALCIGLWLLFGARGLNGLLLWARRAGSE